MKPPVFIVSTGRTGTTFLAEALRQLGARAAHEPGPVWLRVVSNAYVAGAISHEQSMAVVRRTRSPSNRWDVEASCLIYGLVRPILDSTPDARVVHLVRDPRTYVRSAMNWGVHRLGGRPLNLLPFRRLATPHLEGRNPRTLLEWAAKGQLARVCWTWRAMNQAISGQGSGDERFFTIRMEDLFDKTTEYRGFRQILELSGVPLPEPKRLERLLSERVNSAPRQRFSTWEEWSTSHLELLRDECGDLADFYGYTVTGDIDALLSRRSMS